jgi:uncharacterized protein
MSLIFVFSAIWTSFQHAIAQLSLAEGAVLAIAALCIGLAKTGIPNLGMATVPLAAWMFGGKLSTGIMLPMLIVADLMAVSMYARKAEWSYYFKLLPWTLLGILVGTWLGTVLDDVAFKRYMALIFAGSLGYLFYRDFRGKVDPPANPIFAPALGILAGVTTMLGNLAGAATTVFFVSMRLPKWAYLGTSAWFFCTINICKTPLQIIYWKNITWDTLYLNLLFAPVVIFGALLGRVVAQRLPDASFRRLTLGLALMAMILLFL